MTGYASDSQIIEQLFVANANPLLAERLDAFERYPIKNREHVLRALSVKAISLSGDIDRGYYATGNGLALDRYKLGLQKIPPSRGLKLDDSTAMTTYREGIVFDFGLDLGRSESVVVNAEPLFDGEESIRLQYFIPRIRQVGERALLNFVENVEDFTGRLDALIEAAEAHTAKVTRPRVVKPIGFGWPQTLTSLTKRSDGEPA